MVLHLLTIFHFFILYVPEIMAHVPLYGVRLYARERGKIVVSFIFKETISKFKTLGWLVNISVNWTELNCVTFEDTQHLKNFHTNFQKNGNILYILGIFKISIGDLKSYLFLAPDQFLDPKLGLVVAFEEFSTQYNTLFGRF